MFQLRYPWMGGAMLPLIQGLMLLDVTGFYPEHLN